MRNARAFVAVGVVLAACGGTDVQGTVTYADGSTAVGVPVLLTDANGQQFKLTTDAMGRFSASLVAFPYSAAAAIVPNGAPDVSYVAALYLGLTRPDPTVYLTADLPFFQQRASEIAVTLGGGTYPQPAANFTTNLGFVSELAFTTVTLSGPITSVNTLEVFWFNPASTATSGTLFGLQVLTNAAGVATGYTGYGTTPASLTQGVVNTAVLPLEPLTAGTVTGNLHVPAGYTLVELDAYLQLPGGGLLPLFKDTAPLENFSYTVPSLPETTVALQWFAIGGDYESFWFPATVLAANAPSVDFDCPLPPTQVSPVANATGVTRATPFTWSETPGASAYGVQFGTYLYVHTPATTLVVPDLSYIGLDVFGSSTEPQQWLVSAVSGSSVNELATPYLSPSPLGSYCNAVSQFQSFTAAAGQ